jgi:hypothetical protein
MRKARLLSTLVLVMLAIPLAPGMVLADSPLPGAIPVLDEPATGPPPGYRVDEPSPGAVVKRVPVQPDGVSPDNLPGQQYRAGWTDGWWAWKPLVSYDHVGSHTSKSDLLEDQIVVRGYMRVGGGSSWDDSCSCDNRPSTTCHCTTLKNYPLFQYPFYVESHHFFRKQGYADNYFETGKNVP